MSQLKLKSHEKTHSKSRPFKCIDCGKTFTGLRISSFKGLTHVSLLSPLLADLPHADSHARAALPVLVVRLALHSGVVSEDASDL